MSAAHRLLASVVLCACGSQAAIVALPQSSCKLPQYKWTCTKRCYDSVSQDCTAELAGVALDEATCRAISANHSWSSCRCFCEKKVCSFGCYDTEDELCHADTNEMQCAEIYGHVEWASKCNCRFSGDETEQAEPQSRKEVNIYFSVPAFIVLFRESLEVVIVLVIILQFLQKSRDDGIISPDLFKKFRREVYVGASIGFCMCLVLGVGFLVLASQFRKLFKGDNLRIFDGVMMILTCIVLSFLALNFYKMIHTKEGHERKMKEKIEQARDTAKDAEDQGSGAFGRKHAFFVLAFSTGLREGLESIIFLVGVVSDVKDLSSLPLPIITALVLARLVGCCFFQGTKKMRVDWFMRASAAVLTVIAAGFFSQSVHKFQELGMFGKWHPRAERPWANSEVWNISECCNDKTNRFFVLMRAMLGYQDRPTPIEFIAYALYWVLAVIIGVLAIKHVKRQLDKKVAEWQAADKSAAMASQENAEQSESKDDTAAV